MAVYATNIIIYTGTDFEQTFILENSGNSALNLTGYTGSSQFKRYKASSQTETFNLIFVDRNIGKIKIEMNANSTSQLKSGKYFYDVKITSPSGVTTRVVEGTAIVKKSVTR